MTISKGKNVAITYTLTLDNGEVVDSSSDAEPLTFTFGMHQLIPGLEAALEGRSAGETFRVSVPPEEAYGPVSENAFIPVPKEHLPPEALQIGAQITAVGPQEQELQGIVVELTETTATVDFNDPLAGETLHFDVTVLSVE